MYKVHVMLAATLTASLFTTVQTQADTERQNIEETTVIGQYLYSNQINALKSPTPVLDVPQSLSIITAEQITQQGFNSIGDIVLYTPGVNTSQGEGHRDAVVFRGVRSTADFYIDGVRDDVQYYRPLYNLEQVEILRGPNALLFGRGGTGGILNRVTKKAEIGEQFNAYKASVDSEGEYGVQLDSNFSTGDASAVRINLMYEGLENHRDFYDGDRIGFNPTVKFALSPDTTLDLSYEYVDHERFIDRGVPTGANGEPVEAFEDIVFADPDLNTTELEAHLLRATLEHNFSSDMKGRISGFYGDYDKLYQNLYASGYDQVATPNEVTLDGYIDTTQRKSLILSSDLIWEFNSGALGHKIVTGIEYIDTSNNNDRYNTFWNTTEDDNEVFSIARPLNVSAGMGVNSSGVTTINNFNDPRAFNDDTEADITTFSIYIQDEIEINEQFDLLLGARFDSFDTDVDIFDINETTGELFLSDQQSNKDEEISPRLGLIYKPEENISIYASYSESFLPRSGEQYASTSDLDPDVFENTEIGIKWDFVQGLSLTAAYFQNEQTRSDRDDTTGEGFEIRGLEVDGIELQLLGQITEKLSITAGYSNLDGETDEGREIPRELPENTFSLWGSYQVTEAFGVGLGATYQDESFITDFDIGSTEPHPTLPSYTRFDVAAYYDVSPDLRVQLNVENLTDELYFPNAHSTHQATVGAPLTALVTVSGKF